MNNDSRNDVVAFWHAIYQASEGYENRVKWTGNYTGNNGTVAPEFVADVERRLNYFRAMCGVSSDVQIGTGSTVAIEDTDAYKPSPSTLKLDAAQNAALMLVRNYNPATGANPALTHTPSSNLIGWSSTSWNANAKGNFAFGLYGPGAITEYMIEQLSRSAAVSSWNSLVGHRRWNLYPRATTFATGDQPGSSVYKPPTNVFYVIQKESELVETAESGFVSYPSAGYFPAPLNTPFWSLSYAGADFSQAQVEMTDSSGHTIPTVAVRYSSSYGDPAIVWEVSPGISAQSVSRDTTFNVTVSGIAGENVPETWSYAVTLINPDVLKDRQRLAGSSSQSPTAAGIYTFTPAEGAEATQVAAFQRVTGTWKEDAESASRAKVIDSTSGNYPLIVNPSTFTGFGQVVGKAAFHLTFPTSYDLISRNVPEQSFELDREILAGSKTALTFKYRRGYMTRNSFLAVESSKDGGVTWRRLGSSIRGVSDTQMDTKTSTAKFTIAKSSYPQRIRFRYYTTGGAIYTHEATPKSATGIFIDEITTTGSEELVLKRANGCSPGTNSFTFNSSTSGRRLIAKDKWVLRMRSKLGGKWFPYGPLKSVTIASE